MTTERECEILSNFAFTICKNRFNKYISKAFFLSNSKQNIQIFLNGKTQTQ